MITAPTCSPTASTPSLPRPRALRERVQVCLTRVEHKTADGQPTGRWSWLPLAPDAWRIVTVVVES